jgi:hypothetical protein
VVASRVKDITSAGSGSDAVANSELLVERRFFSKYPHRFSILRTNRILSPKSGSDPPRREGT